jgi:Protein of unknown function (DUF2934)
MSPEVPQGKKPRKASAKKGLTNKAAEIEMPVAAPVFVATAEAAPIAAKTTAAKPKTPALKTKAKKLELSLDDIIRLRAYEIYLQRGATPGNQHEDWQIAEREVREHFSPEAEA